MSALREHDQQPPPLSPETGLRTGADIIGMRERLGGHVLGLDLPVLSVSGEGMDLSVTTDPILPLSVAGLCALLDELEGPTRL